jgi:phosphate transport system ATP-binding protein
MAASAFKLGDFGKVRDERFGDEQQLTVVQSKPQFTVESLNFFYANFQALHSLNMRIPQDKVTALIGPSGCGKSTFLRILNRMSETVPNTRHEGKVLLGEQDLFSFHPTTLRQRVGMVFQRPNPFPKSIFDNVAYGVRVNRMLPASQMKDRVEQSLRRAALWEEVKDKLHVSALSLSGGQQQRLCIARSLAVEPEVLLLDEPCSALDPLATSKIEDLIFELKGLCTIVIVTHNMLQAARVADYVGFFLSGKLIEFEGARKMFMNPTDKQTEDYLTGRFG